jgi:5-methyltetrahydrofolate--homocysteine methyltransferase
MTTLRERIGDRPEPATVEPAPAKKYPDIADLLRRKGVLIYDGSTGASLQEMGMRPGGAPEAFMLEAPGVIFALEEAFVNAGSDLILTNTFGGSPIRLDESDLSAQAFEINRRAVEIAREAAGNRALVAGSIGPSGQLLSPLGSLEFNDAVDAFETQARGLIDGGVDLVQVETMSDLMEARAAVEAVRRVSKEIPVFVTMTFDTFGRTMMGTTPAQAAEELLKWPISGFGANCGQAPEETVAFIREMRGVAPNAILIAKPNAGLPKVVGGKNVWDATPEDMAALAVEFVKAGANIVGGCCGNTPKHIEAMRQRLDEFRNA